MGGGFASGKDGKGSSNSTQETTNQTEVTTTNIGLENIDGTASAVSGDNNTVNITDGGAFELVAGGFNRYTDATERGFRDMSNDLLQGFGQSLNLLGEQVRGNSNIASQNTQLANNVINESIALASQSQRGQGENVLLKFNDSLKWIVLAIAAIFIFKGLS